jgi:membrane protein
MTRAHAEPSPARAWSPRTWLAIAKRVVKGVLAHRLEGLAAEVAFFALFALPPTLLALGGAIGFVGDAVGPDVTARARAELMLWASQFLTPEVLKEFVGPTFDKLLREGGRADLISVGALFTVASASRTADSLLSALQIAYALDHRFANWRRRGLALLYTIVALLWGGVILPLVVVGPDFGRALTKPVGLDTTFDKVWSGLYWPVVAILLLLTLTAVYHFAVPWRTPFLRDLPGAISAMGLWILAGTGVRTYAAWAVESSPIYGSLAAPMVVLVWLYFLAYSILLGAEVNAAIEATWPTSTRREKKAVLRQAVAELRDAGEEVAPVSVTARPDTTKPRSSKPHLSKVDPTKADPKH